MPILNIRKVVGGASGQQVDKCRWSLRARSSYKSKKHLGAVPGLDWADDFLSAAFQVLPQFTSFSIKFLYRTPMNFDALRHRILKMFQP